MSRLRRRLSKVATTASNASAATMLPNAAKRMKSAPSGEKGWPSGLPQINTAFDASAAKSMKTMRPMKRSMSTLAAASTVRRVSTATA